MSDGENHNEQQIDPVVEKTDVLSNVTKCKISEQLSDGISTTVKRKQEKSVSPQQPLKRLCRPTLSEAAKHPSFTNIDINDKEKNIENDDPLSSKQNGENDEVDREHPMTSSMSDNDVISSTKRGGTSIDIGVQCEGFGTHHKRRITETTRTKTVDGVEIAEREFFEDSWEEK